MSCLIPVRYGCGFAVLSSDVDVLLDMLIEKQRISGSKNMKINKLTLLVAISASALLVGCNTTTTKAASAPVTVKVSMTDFGIKSDMTAFKVGVPYHFVVTNDGAVPHEIMLLSKKGSMGMTMHEMDEIAMGMIEEDDMPHGAMGSFDVTFKEPHAMGDLEFACHVEGHYEAGMKQDISVTN